MSGLMTAPASHDATDSGVARVLVVDDDPDIGELLTDTLNQAGFDVEVAVDGERGLAAATRAAPHLVLLDWMMPGRSGLEICQVLRATPALDATPIVMLTARGREADVEWGYQAGADDYIVKPFSPRELTWRVRRVLERGRSAGRSVAP